jgi:uncharacterized protein (TIGR03067 family)
MASVLLALTLSGCASSKSSSGEYTSVPSKSAMKPTSVATAAPMAATKSSADSLQGTWKGKELGGDSDGVASLKVEGNRFEFRSGDEKEWYKGTFTLREDADPRQFVALIADCPSQEFIGKTSKAIYRVHDGKLMLAARAPGNEDAPADFNDSESRKFEFTR